RARSVGNCFSIHNKTGPVSPYRHVAVRSECPGLVLKSEFFGDQALLWTGGCHYCRLEGYLARSDRHCARTEAQIQRSLQSRCRREPEAAVQGVRRTSVVLRGRRYPGDPGNRTNGSAEELRVAAESRRSCCKNT